MSNNSYRKINKILSIAWCIIIILTMLSPILYAAETENISYIYLDLYYGNVTISDTTYSGYNENGEEVNGEHVSTNKYYIFQSNGTEIQRDANNIPIYNRVTFGEKTWGSYITNNTNVTEVVSNWTTAANNVNRKETLNYISIKGSSTYDVTIDNIWSSYKSISNSRTTGGICFTPTTGGKTIVRIKGDNRFGNIHYAVKEGTSWPTDATMEFKNGESEGNVVGTITVASFKAGDNHYNSAIGGADQVSPTKGLIFDSGIIYAGATTEDNCTAIGAGGNGPGQVFINGGIVTAVTSSSGVAIGGGIGESSNGGTGEVTITGGNVYAYNFGYTSAQTSPALFIPAAAIGGGSSCKSSGNKGTVKISGGQVYAQSLGGAAIGGGSSSTSKGGDADVTISGNAIVTAKSTKGVDKNGVEINYGAGIGGGTAGENGSGNGGNAKLTISDNAKIYTGSIGGGKANNSTGNIGGAAVNISGGTLQGQVIMSGDSEIGIECSFNMTGGTIDNSTKTDDFVFLEENGGAVHVENGTAIMLNGIIKGCNTATNGGAIYVTGGNFTMTGGSIINNTATNEGGAIYVNDGNIIIGEEICNTQEHVHPNILQNKATTSGGGISVSGGEIIMYCGSVNANIATKDQASNNLNQKGGTFELCGGEINGGISVGGGNFLDLRPGAETTQYTIIYYANIDGSGENSTAQIKANETIYLSRSLFTNEGLYLIGWSMNRGDETGYIPVGSKIQITNNIELYAVWGNEEPIASFTVYIPDTITVTENSNSTNENFEIRAQVKYFTNMASLNVIANGDFKLTETKSKKTINYNLNTSENSNEVNDGDIVATFKYNDTANRTIKAILEDFEQIKYSGQYTDTITFTVEYNDGIEYST